MKDTIFIQYEGFKEPFWYVRLGALLKYIQENIMYIIKIDDTRKSPMLKFDTEVESNLMFVEDLQVSVDPSICLINRTITIGNPQGTYTFTPSNAEQFESSLFPGYNCYGQIMNIYVNMKWILLKLEELKDANTNKIVLIDFLNNMLSSINIALGGTNSLEATVDETTVIIRDINPLPNKDYVITTLNNFYKEKEIDKNISNKSVIFDLYGYNTDQTDPNNKFGHASFIKDFNFTTEITPQLSTMLTVGATANSTVVGENSTAFSRFNTGLTDRFKKVVTTKSEEDKKLILEDIKTIEEEKKALFLKWATTYLNYIEYLKKISVSINSKPHKPSYVANEANTYTDAVTNFTTYLQQARQKVTEEINKKRENEGKSLILPEFLPGTGFIPFNMSITMDGLSGMKIYNQFNIDTQFLPSNYPENAEFLIKNIVHKITNSKWFTTLESIVTIKGDFGKRSNSNLLYNKSGEVIKQKTTFNQPKSVNGVWANRLRNVLKTLGYTEKGTELDNGGDISENIYKAASKVFITIKQELPSLQVIVTGGNDIFHKNLDYASRHKNANALDFTISPSTPTNLNAVVTILQRYAVGNTPNFRFIDEYRHLTKAGTGNHFHISWGAGTEAQQELNKAIALAKQGKISPLKIN